MLALNMVEGNAGVYVLRLRDHSDENGKPCYYVGKSKCKHRRIQQHKEGGATCASWVKQHGGVAAVETPMTPQEQIDSWEQKETIARILMHGFENVRGWEWTSCTRFGPDDYTSFKVTAMGLGDLCRKCGRPGHYSIRCTETSKATWLQQCDDASSSNLTADAKNVIGSAVRSFNTTQGRNKRTMKPNLWCGRCGRSSHTEEQCFANTHVDGSAIRSFKTTQGSKKRARQSNLGCGRCGP